jgi:hypothetical protein
MELSVNYLRKSSGYTLDYIFKILRLSCINSRILLNKEEIINLRSWLKRNCSTNKRYQLYLIVNTYLENERCLKCQID